MLGSIQLNPELAEPLYRQLHARIKEMIGSGTLGTGDRLPPTRELAGLLGLNRATVSAAYALLESEGLIRGHVGRGSFVLSGADPHGINWDQFLPAWQPGTPPAPPAQAISFATSRPAEELFPMEDFRRTCEEVLAGPHACAILQLGIPAGYAPLREYLMEQSRHADLARAQDDVLITNGCQQAIDLIQRVLVRPGDTVLIEDPVYPGLRNAFTAAGAQMIGVPVGPEGLIIGELERLAARVRPRLLVVTSNFQNPTGTTLPASSRAAIAKLARAGGFVVVENDIYGDLRYEGEAPPLVKQVDASGDTVLLRSFSKLAFPGLRVGWVLGPRPLIARLTEAKQLADLHTDQLSQAVLLRFAESGRLEAHRQHMLRAGAERRRAVITACERCLPPGSNFTRPAGGMNLWVRLPEPLDSSELLGRAHAAGVSYLPGKYFTVSRREPGGLRLSFAGLAPEKIRKGLEILGEVFRNELARTRLESREPAPAVV